MRRFRRRSTRVRVNDIMSVTRNRVAICRQFRRPSRAFLQVQNGCDHRCTFCIIPLWPRQFAQRRRRAQWSKKRARLVEKGFAEIVLTGVDLTSYGADLPGTPTLGRLVRKILKLVPELKRLRLSSIDSIEADAN